MRDSSFLRWVDRYCGACLCFVLSLVKRARRLWLGPKAVPAVYKKVLIVELFEMGAAVMAHSALGELRASSDGVEIYCVCLKGNEQAWSLMEGHADSRMITIDGSSLFAFAFSFLQVAWRLRSYHFDLVIDFDKFSRVSTVLGACALPAQHAGFFRYAYEGLYRGNLLDINCSFNQNVHISRNFLGLVRTILSTNRSVPNFKGEIQSQDIKPPRYTSDAALREIVSTKLRERGVELSGKKLLLVCPDVGPNLVMRNYPRSSFKRVIDILLERMPDAVVVLIGVPANEDACRDVCAQVANNRCVNFCGVTASVRELIEVISLAELLITNDSGPAHFASLTPTRIVALFGMETPFMYGPLGQCVTLYSHFHCSPCVSVFNNKVSPCRDNQCLKVITPERVVDVALQVLADKIPYRTINGLVQYI